MTSSTIAQRSIGNAASEPKHKWEKKGSRLPPDTPSGCEETERLCIHCHLTMITVHVPHGHPYRAWRARSGLRWIDDARPLCDGGEVSP